MNTEYPPRHLPPFRPLVPGEQWHRLDFTPEMLPDGWRPLLLGEIPTFEDQYRYPYTGEWTDAPSQGKARSMSNPRRTRRPLPPPPPTFEHGGKVWNSHVPGDPCPVDEDTEVYVLYVDSTVGHGCANDFFWELDKAKLKIGYRIPEADPVNDTDKMSDSTEVATLKATVRRLDDRLADSLRRISELEQQLATAIRDAVVAACKPQLRPIAEMPAEVPEGCVRKFAESGEWLLSSDYYEGDTHFIDIALPTPPYPADFEKAFAESKLDTKDKDAAFKLWKGGAR